MASPEPKFRRILLKLSGEALMGDRDYGTDAAEVKRIAEQVRRRSPGADRRQLVTGRIDRLVHSLFGVSEKLIDHLGHGSRGYRADPLETSVPTLSPETILSMLRSSAMLKT